MTQSTWKISFDIYNFVPVMRNHLMVYKHFSCFYWSCLGIVLHSMLGLTRSYFTITISYIFHKANTLIKWSFIIFDSYEYINIKFILIIVIWNQIENLPFNQIGPVDPHRKTAGHSVGILPSPSSLYQPSLKSRSHCSWSEVPRAYSTDLVGSFKIWLSVQGSWAPIPII